MTNENSTNESSPAPAETYSTRFCAPTSDITFSSSDHVLFQVHRKNLECTTEGFSPPPGTSSSSTEIVQLPERSAVLELLFQYMYPQRQPELALVPFDVFKDLAEAAEKYQVYAAMGVCNTRMMNAHKEHPFEVLLYGARHGYPHIVCLVERWSLELSPAEALSRFPLEIFTAWTQYYTQWSGVVHYASTYIKSFPEHNVDHLAKIARTLARLGAGPVSLRDLDATFESFYHGVYGCSICNVSRWRLDVAERIAGLKGFSAFL